MIGTEPVVSYLRSGSNSWGALVREEELSVTREVPGTVADVDGLSIPRPIFCKVWREPKRCG